MSRQRVYGRPGHFAAFDENQLDVRFHVEWIAAATTTFALFPTSSEPSCRHAPKSPWIQRDRFRASS